jgi:DNA-binding response OmpR family regulator
MADLRSTQTPLTGLSILLLEDDPLIRLDLETSLEDLGAIVLGASDLNTALAHLDAVLPDFAVLDFELGGTTSEPVAQLARHKGVPFLFLSGYGERDGHFARWPGIQILVKPISVMAIAHIIGRVLGRDSEH